MNSDGSLLLVLFASGVAAGGLCHSLLHWVAAVPPGDDRFRDRPPWALRLVWWPIRWLAHYLGRFAPDAAVRRGQLRLISAGLDYALTAPQWWAAQTLAVVGASVVGTALATALHLSAFGGSALGALAAWVLARSWLRDRIARRQGETVKTLPFFLDLVTLCVEAGLNLNAALAQAVARGPHGALRDELQRVLRDMRAGKSRADALRSFADRMGNASVSYLVTALIQAEVTGMSLGPLLRAQAEQRRAERFALAEKKAMEAPVKLLLPLIGFIFPCTFIVLGFPVVMKFMQLGL